MQFQLLFSKFLVILTPTLVILSVTKDGEIQLAAFIAIVTVHINMAKALIPLGRDLELQRHIFESTYKSPDAKKMQDMLFQSASRDVFKKGPLVSICFLTSLSFALSRNNQTLSMYEFGLYFFIFMFSAFNSLIVSISRNTVTNVKSVLVDGIFGTTLPFLIIWVLTLTDSLDASWFTLIVALGYFFNTFVLLYLNIEKWKLISSCGIFKSITKQGLDVSKEQNLILILIVANLRFPMIYISWFMSPSQIVLADLLSRVFQVLTVFTWTSGIVNNATFLNSSGTKLRRILRAQQLLGVSLWSLVNVLMVWYIINFIPSLFADSINIVLHTAIVLAMLPDIGVALFGYILNLEKNYKPMLNGQAAYFTITLLIILLKDEVSFIFLFLIAAVIRYLVYHKSIRELIKYRN